MERSVWLRWINLALLAIPVVLLLKRLDLGEGPIILVLAAITLVPLSSFLESAVDELEELFGQFIGGLLHTTFGNAAELAIALSLLLAQPPGETGSSQIVLSSVAGVVIRNSLLILGVAAIAGALRNGRMRFSPENAGEYSSFFALAVTGLCLPTVAFLVARASNPAITPEEIRVFGHYSVSLSVAIALLVAYIAYILFAVFRFRAGENLVERAQAKRTARRRRSQRSQGAESVQSLGMESLVAAPGVQALFKDERALAEEQLAESTGQVAVAAAEAPEEHKKQTARSRYAAEKRQARRMKEGLEDARGEAEGLLHRNRWLRIVLALVILGAAATGVVFMSEAFAGSVEFIGKQYEQYVNGFFLGLILIPVVGGAVELFDAVGMARRNLIELTMGITAGASIQMITVVVPTLVIVGQLTNHPLLLNFNPLEVIIFVAGSFLFMLLSRDGEATLLEGVQLCSLWALLAATAYFLPPVIAGG